MDAIQMHEDSKPSLSSTEEGCGVEAVITSHSVFGTFGGSPAQIDILNRDLFSSHREVVLSALSTLGALKNSSIKHISRLFTHDDEEIQREAVRTAGETGNTAAIKILTDLFKTSHSDSLKSDILKALFNIAPHEPEVASLIRSYVNSSTIRSEKAVAVGLLLRIDDRMDVARLLEESIMDGSALDEIIRVAETNPRVASSVVEFGSGMSNRMAIQSRLSLLRLASIHPSPKARLLFNEALADPNPEIRQACYRGIDSACENVDWISSIVEKLCNDVELDPALEDEVSLAISRLEGWFNKKRTQLTPRLREKILQNVKNLYDQLLNAGSRTVQDSHELGWLIMKSKEYVEYYCDESLKNAIVKYLKGSGNYSMNELLQRVKGSAVKVEVRHFDGYKALHEIIKQPKRPGTALITREIAIAKLGKRQTMYLLMRNLRLAKLFQPTSESELFMEIYNWSRKAKLYRLSEAALNAFAKLNIQEATSACLACMALPLESKILAIASVRLLRDLDWKTVKPAVFKLLSQTDEPHILLNVLDALSAMNIPLCSEMVKMLLSIFTRSTDTEVLSRIASLLGEKSDYTILDELMRIYGQSEENKKELILSVIHRLLVRNNASKDLSLSEFLYGVLRTEDTMLKNRAAVILYKMGDDYALNALKNLVASIDVAGQTDLIRRLSGTVKVELLEVLAPLIRIENSIMQRELRETLLSTDDQDTQEKLLEAVYQMRTTRGLNEIDEECGHEDEVSIDFSREKSSYKFEQEHMWECAVLFTDIKDYSKKAQMLTSMELTALIQEYEGILLPLISTHDGELVKRMGDGHFFAFESALNAALAAVRVQKALKRFNSYREEKLRIMIRIGIHWGKVIRKDGDMLGNTVNIASRLESSAREGSVYISQEVNERISSYVLSREIGLIKVKGIEKPMMVYEPTEVALDLPEKMDPVKRSSMSRERVKNADRRLQEKKQIEGTDQIRYLFPHIKQTFAHLNALCLKVEKGEADPAIIRRELMKRWSALKALYNDTL